MPTSCHRPEWSEEMKDCRCDTFTPEEMGEHWYTICADCGWFRDDEEYEIRQYNLEY